MNYELSNLEVHYGWAKLNKIRKRPALSVVFENSYEASAERGEQSLRKFQVTFYTRKQTIQEAEDGAIQNRIFTEYSMFLFDPKVKGDLEYLLEQNFIADKNNVPEEIREEIRTALRNGFKKVYNHLNEL